MTKGNSGDSRQFLINRAFHSKTLVYEDFNTNFHLCDEKNTYMCFIHNISPKVLTYRDYITYFYKYCFLQNIFCKNFTGNTYKTTISQYKRLFHQIISTKKLTRERGTLFCFSSRPKERRGREGERRKRSARGKTVGGEGGYSRHLISTWRYVWLNAFEQFFIKVPQPPFPPKGFPLAPWRVTSSIQHEKREKFFSTIVAYYFQFGESLE